MVPAAADYKTDQITHTDSLSHAHKYTSDPTSLRDSFPSANSCSHHTAHDRSWCAFACTFTVADCTAHVDANSATHSNINSGSHPGARTTNFRAKQGTISCADYPVNQGAISCADCPV